MELIMCCAVICYHAMHFTHMAIVQVNGNLWAWILK
jgi:hypothetical protein